MSIAQRAKNFWLGTVGNRWLIGRRMVFSFKNAENPQVLVLRFPSADKLSFAVVEESDSGRVWFSLKMTKDGEDSHTLARFQSKDEGLIALGRIRRKVAGGVARLIKVAAAVILVLLLINGVGSLLGGGAVSVDQRQASLPSASSMSPEESDQLLREMLTAAEKNPLGPTAQPAAAPEAESMPEGPRSGADALVDALQNAK